MNGRSMVPRLEKLEHAESDNNVVRATKIAVRMDGLFMSQEI